MQKFPSPTDWESELEFQSQKLDYAIVSWLFFLHSTTERTAHDVNKSEAFKWAGTNMRFKWDLSVEIGCFNWEMRWDERWEVVGKKKRMERFWIHKRRIRLTLANDDDAVGEGAMKLKLHFSFTRSLLFLSSGVSERDVYHIHKEIKFLKRASGKNNNNIRKIILMHKFSQCDF